MADIELGSIEIKTGENTSEEIKIPASSVSGLAKVATSGSYNDLSNKPPIPDVSGKLSKTENTGVNVLGTTKATTTLGGNQLVAPNGIIFAGTAANAGLVTRGICGVTTPDSKGACSKENLYINYDGNNDFNAGRQVVLNAGAVGNHLGSNMYQYTAPRGEIVKNWVEAKGYATSVKVNSNTIASSGGVVDIGTVLTDASKFATSAQGTKADNAMPKAGGAFTGAVTVQAPTAEMNPATKQYVDTAINAVKQFEYQVVTELPTAAQATMGKIYLKAHSHNPSDGQPDSYDEFITVQSGSTYKWERIGNTDIDLSGYVPTTRKINNKALSSNITLYPTDVGVTEEAFPGLNKTGTITGINMNGASKGTSGVVDLGTVLTDESKFATSAQGTKADNAMPKSGGTFTGPVSSKSYYKSENADLRTSTTLSHIAVNVDNGRTNSHTAYMNGQINIKSASSSSEKTITIPDKAGTIALTSDIPSKTSQLTNDSGFTANKGTVTSVSIKMNGASKGTVTSSGTIDLGTVLTDASQFATSAQGTKADNALSLDGGTINKSKTIKMDASANSNGANLKWGTVNSKNPYIGYASDQVDGTFVVGSLLGTNYASGLAIGGGSGNLLWKGTKVATINDIPPKVTESTVSGWGFTKNTGTVTQVKINGATKSPNSAGLVDLGTGFAKTADLPIKSASLSGTTLYLTL